MEPLVKDDQPNEASILAQIDKVAQARAELEKANARYLLALRSKLTPEQWKTVAGSSATRRCASAHELGTTRSPAGWCRAGRTRPGGRDGPQCGAAAAPVRRACWKGTAPRCAGGQRAPERSDSAVAGDSNDGNSKGVWQRATAVVVNTDGGEERSSCRRFLCGISGVGFGASWQECCRWVK